MPLARTSDADIHYELLGDGEPVMLVAGLGGTASYWACLLYTSPSPRD